jgi:hypothetical protein
MLRRAQVYLPKKDGAAIVAPMYQAGFYYEQKDVIMVPDWRKASSLSGALRLAMERFSLSECEARIQKKSDWPSYRASGIRSIREFEKTFLSIGVIAVNETELFYDAATQPDGEEEISLHTTLNRYAKDDEFVRPLFRLFDATVGWSFKPMIS